MHRVGFVVPPNFQLMSLAAMTAFEVANLPSPKPHYRVTVLSEKGGPVRSSGGFSVNTTKLADQRFDTMILGSITSLEPPVPSQRLIKRIQRASESARRSASICTGAFYLAEAGILDGRRATTHWFHAASFRTRFPRIRMEQERIYINDGPVWTSAGMSAGIDMVLAMIENDLGTQHAKEVAKILVINERRRGGRKQQSVLLEMVAKTERIDEVIAYIRQNLKKDLSVDELAEVANLSPRQFRRVFAMEIGQTPAKVVETLRMEAAQFMIEEGQHPVNAVAREVGFGDPERMRRAFRRNFASSPRALRKKAKVEVRA
ncbi:GlxA family transcriptional regulator [Tardiphaga sp. P9-11]|uniref:GlxA family transcriptional regulator n=1 Tax=Tardiphaga sp. P9-11 TaxID=2024614 RepID=UPI0011F1E2F7|nr:GlxA family transcriptional regulator [Tardiphaga sp. P9-11]KAA0069984.1 GlxA family transcriptional regulator [Tardiphaga sp. P9-11]